MATCSELLAQIDDRYVIVNSGDEMSLRFPEQPPPPAGWVRDFVVMGDGWIKDGDFNSTFSKTVLPLPYHAKNEYITRAGQRWKTNGPITIIRKTGRTITRATSLRKFSRTHCGANPGPMKRGTDGAAISV